MKKNTAIILSHGRTESKVILLVRKKVPVTACSEHSLKNIVNFLDGIARNFN